jgi:hypothetical protein
MPEKATRERAKKAKSEGKAPSTQAGEFVREEMHHVREGKHGARSTKQAIAIGLSKARRAGVDLPTQGTSSTTKKSTQAGRKRKRTAASRTTPSPKRSRAAKRALSREPKAAASKRALTRQAKSAARRRSAADRSASARRGARTKGPAKRSAAARRAARTRARHAAND